MNASERTVPVADIHMHCIPGVDDGARDLEMALELLRLDHEQGVRMIFCTSHDTGYDPSTRIGYPKEEYIKLKEAAAKAYPDMQLYLGCEVYCIPYFMDEIIDRLWAGEYPTMNGTKAVLVEFPTWGITVEEIKYCVQRLNESGFQVIVAHAERYCDVINGIQTIRELREMRCLFQVNAYSIAMEQRPGVRELAEAMLDEKLIDFIGSDAHRTTHRPPECSEGVQELFRRCDKEYAEEICWKNAEKWLLQTI